MKLVEISAVRMPGAVNSALCEQADGIRNHPGFTSLDLSSKAQIAFVHIRVHANGRYWRCTRRFIDARLLLTIITPHFSSDRRRRSFNRWPVFRCQQAIWKITSDSENRGLADRLYSHPFQRRRTGYGSNAGERQTVLATVPVPTRLPVTPYMSRAGRTLPES